ncbi:MAG: class I SAM-dependent methyltransferase [Magnetospirillum sp.]|nr:class I SAM-dependent methyltransferase [Magnetospirillum sp.]
MPVIADLLEAYEAEGIDISTGLNSWHLKNCAEAPFTWFMRDGKSLTQGLGIALQEVYLVECLLSAWRPKRMLVVGNSYGWSTVALALANPEGRTLGLDTGANVQSVAGIHLTNKIAKKRGLDCYAVAAASPGGVAPTVARELKGPVEFAFIDGEHTREALARDLAAVRDVATPDCVYLCHDVLNFDLRPTVAEFAERHDLAFDVLTRTPSGMAIVRPREGTATGLERAIHAFAGSEDLFRRWVAQPPA